jgi:hypothetical protein
VIAHLVLFTPRPELGDAERKTIRDALKRAFEEIPAIRRSTVGQRVRLGTAYDRAAPLDFEFLAIIEVDDTRALADYLAHPAHQDLGRLFYETSAHALACDFELREISELQ